MRYRDFISDKNPYDRREILRQLIDCNATYEQGFPSDITYLIFNKGFNNRDDYSDICRIDVVCNVGTFPHEMFNVSLEEDYRMGCYRTVRETKEFELEMSAPFNLHGHSYYMIFFKLDKINLLSEEVATRILMHIDLL